MAKAIVRPGPDDAAFSRMLATQPPRLLAVLRWLGADDARDVVQDVG
jgi:hypothetical protein